MLLLQQKGGALAANPWGNAHLRGAGLGCSHHLLNHKPLFCGISNNEFAQLLPFINFQTGRMQGAKSPYAVVIPGSALGAQFSLENSPFLHHSVR